jgi:hypothetical protein
VNADNRAPTSSTAYTDVPPLLTARYDGLGVEANSRTGASVPSTHAAP